MKYTVVLDLSRPLLDALPTIEAASPKAAAEIYCRQSVVRHMEKRGDVVVIASTVWPIKTYIYNRKG